MKPILAGLTGGIGSGKSVVARIFSVLGYPVFDADEAGKKLLAGDHDVMKKVKELLGASSYDINGLPDRLYIAGKVFNDEMLLRQLNEIIHPAVAEKFEKWVLENNTKPLLVKEAAIMFESGSNEGLDKIVALTAPVDLRIERVVKRDGRTKEDVIRIMNNQLPEAVVVERSDFMIINDGKQPLITQTIETVRQILKIKKST